MLIEKGEINYFTQLIKGKQPSAPMTIASSDTQAVYPPDQ